MTQEEHYNAYQTFQKLAMDALHAFMEDTTDDEMWNAYKEMSKTANKHFGIMRAMRTKALKKQ